jgi:hypothetical protein
MVFSIAHGSSSSRPAFASGWVGRLCRVEPGQRRSSPLARARRRVVGELPWIVAPDVDVGARETAPRARALPAMPD